MDDSLYESLQFKPIDNINKNNLNNDSYGLQETFIMHDQCNLGITCFSSADMLDNG